MQSHQRMADGASQGRRRYNNNRPNNNRGRNNNNRRNNNQGGGNGSYSAHNGGNNNRHIESNGPHGRLKGTPQFLYDKYMNFGREAQTAGDWLEAERFYQFAEHYIRLGGPFVSRHVQTEEKSNAPQQAESAEDTSTPAPESHLNGALHAEHEIEQAFTETTLPSFLNAQLQTDEGDDLAPALA